MKKLVLGMAAAGLIITAGAANAATDYNANYYGDDYNANYTSTSEFNPTQSTPVAKSSHDIQLFVQGQIGWVSQSHENLIKNDKTLDYDNGNIGGGAAVGIFLPLGSNLSIGAQVGYDYYGKTKVKKTPEKPVDPPDDELKASDDDDGINIFTNRTMAVDALAIAKISFGKFNLIGGGGVAYEFNNVSSDDSNDDNYNGFSPEMMVGISYNVADNMTAGVQYKHIFGNKIDSDDYKKDEDSMGKVSVNAVMATISYTL